MTTPTVASLTSSSETSIEAPHDIEAPTFRALTSALRGDNEPHEMQSLEWSNLTFKIGDKSILKNCSGLIKPGTLTAVLGPSGSGKSTLMNVVGGRQSTKGGKKSMSGEVSFGGRVEDPVKFRSKIAYVMQDDSLTATATPKEVLQFSAKLRLSAAQQKGQKVDDLVDDLLASLKLSGCANTLVGNDLLKGISGGERKRTSVGVELITAPEMIFLDEPLSGLDSYAAHTTVKVLKELAHSGVPVMVTVHQPSSEIFELFDEVLIICEGETVFHGPRDEIVPYFLKHGGFKCPTNYNPADFALFVLQTESKKSVHKLVKAHNVIAEETILPEVLKVRKAHASIVSVPSKPHRAPLLTQVRELVIRDTKDLYRNPIVLVMRYVMLLVLGLLFGCVFFDAGANESEDYWLQNTSKFQSYFGGMVSLLMGAMMGPAQSTLLRYPAQRSVFLREYASNMYSSVTYVLSKTITELPLSLFDSLVQVMVAYWLMNFQGNFAGWVMVVWFVNVSSSSLAQMLGAACNSAAQAMQLLPLMTVPQILFTGMFTPISNIPAWLRWMQYLCFLKYCVNLAYLNEFGVDFDRLNTVNDIEPDMMGLYVGIVFALIVVFRVASLAFLKRKARYVF